MKGMLRFCVLLSLCLVVLFATQGCGSGSESEPPANETSEPAQEAVAEGPEGEVEEVSEGDDGKGAAMVAAWKAAAASQGIYSGEIPDDFPVALVPPHPDGTIDRSALQEGEATLLQNIPGTVDGLYSHYKDFYEGLGWSAAAPITVAGRTMAGFTGDGVQVDMTLTDQGDGRVFVSLALY